MNCNLASKCNLLTDNGAEMEIATDIPYGLNGYDEY
jgi:hypothetical protein